MTQPTEGTAFFSVENNFQKTAEDFAQLEAAVTRTLSGIRTQFSSFQGVEFNPLDKVYDKVNQQAGLIERRLQDLFRKYQTFAKSGQTPEQPFALAANQIVQRGLTQVDKSVTAQAGKLGDVDLGDLRRTLLSGLADGGTAAARELRNQLAAALREGGGDERAIAGHANTLRAANVARPVVQDIPESQTGAEYVAATKAAAKARQDSAKAVEESTAADQAATKASRSKAAKDTKDAAASSGSGGGTPPPASPAPPAPPTPPTPPPPPTGGGGAGDEGEEVRQLLERLSSGLARFVNRGNTIFDPEGPNARATGEEFINARTLNPEPPVIAERLRQIIDNEVAALNRQLAAGSLQPLGSRFATQPFNQPDEGRTFLDRATGQPVDNEADFIAATNALADARRKATDATARMSAAEAAAAARLSELQEELRSGAAQFIGRTNTVFRPNAPAGQDIVGASNGQPLPGPLADRLRQQVQDQLARVAQLEQQLTRGQLIPLGNRFATQPVGSVPDDQRTVIDRANGLVVTNAQDLADAYRRLADEVRKAAAQDEAELVRSAERAYAQELLRLAEDVAAKRRAGIQGPDTGVQVGTNGTIIDSRRSVDDPNIVRLTNGGAAQQLSAQQDLSAAASLRATRERVAAAETDAYTRQLREAEAASKDMVRAQRDFARTTSRSGFSNNFLHGLTSGGFGGDGSDGLDGLARAAGQTAKYSTLYQALNLVQTALRQTVAGFLDANDSITEYQVATGRADAVNAHFLTGLENVAEVSGFNVGEALDVASKAVRAFADDTDRSQQSLDRLAQAFTTQASRLATLAKTNLTDAAGNLTAVASGFDLPKNGAGFAQVTDAIAGAKLAGGGDETQIFQGLANAAITFKNLGFSLNESATILSKINAQTDESGTLIATRLSRLTSVLNGQAAGKFIQSLNQQLGPGQQIDQTAPQRDQLIQLGRAYQSLGEAQRGALVSSLGGTAEERELSVLLQNITQIVDEANKIQPGQGLKEFDARLTNVRAQLNEIGGFIKTIIVNLTTSGLTAPIIELVGALKGALSVLSDISKFFKVLDDATSRTFGGLNVGITSVVSNLGALLLAVKGLQALRNNGGLRGVLSGAEQLVAPNRALARQQLNGTLPGGSADTPLAGFQGRAAAAASKAQSAIDLPSGVAADADVREAGVRVRQAAERLARAEEEQAVVVARQTQERRAVRADLGSNGDRVRDLNARHEQELADAAQAGVTAQLDLATAQAQLARTLRVQAAQAEVAAQFDARRGAVSDSFQRQIGRAQIQGEHAFAAGDSAGLEAANRRELALREEFNVKLGAVEAERLLAEQRATAAAAGGALSRGLDAASLGGVGAAAVAREEGAGVLGVARAFSATTVGAIGRGVTSLAKFIGPAGLILGLTDFALQVKGASDAISQARADLREVGDQFKNNPLTVQSLNEQASSEASAAQNIKEARGGLVGGVADFLNGSLGARDQGLAERSATATKNAADALADISARLRIGPAGTAAAASTIDITSTDTISNSFQQLTSLGYTTAQSMDILTERIKQLRLVISGTSDLTEFEKGQISQGAGAFSAQLLQNPEFQRPVFVQSGGTTTDLGVASHLINSSDLQTRSQKIVADQLARGADLGSDQGSQGLEKALEQGYAGLVPTPAIAASIAKQIADYVKGKAREFAGHVNSVADLQNLVAQGIQVADADAARAGSNAQLAALTNGVRDSSASVASATRLGDLQRTRALAQSKLDALKASGVAPTADQRNELQVLDDKITDAQVQNFQALAQDAQAALSESEKIRQARQGKARTASQIRAIGQAAYQQLDKSGNIVGGDVKTALDSGSVDLILQVFNLASREEINLTLKAVDDLVKTRQAAAVAAEARAQAAQAALAAIGQHPGDFASGLAEASAQAVADAAKADAAKAKKDAAAAAGQSHAAHRAAAQAAPTNTYDTGIDRVGGGGDTIEQINAAFAQARAVRDRNSTEVLRAAVTAAQADYDAAKDQKAKAQALQQLYQAQNALADQLKNISVARATVNIFPASAVQSAAKSLAQARADLSKYAAGTLEYYNALAQVVQAQRQLADAHLAAQQLRAKLTIDLTNPVATARQAVRDAQQKLALLRREGAPSDLTDQARLDLRNAQNSAESAAFSQRFSDAQTNDQLGRISHAAYIRYLDNEHNRLTAIRHRTRQQQDELNQVDQALKSAGQELQGQFNLGDIKIPTPYEVRRYIATQAKAATTAATASAATTAGAVAQAAGNSVSIQINGADVAFVRQVLAQYLGPSATSTLAVSASRKG